MRPCRVKLLLLALCLAASACSKPQATPTTSPASDATDAGAGTPLPATVVLKVNGHDLTFAAPRAVIGGDGEDRRLLLYSDQENATGSFYFQAPGETDEKGITHWTLDASYPDPERSDSLVGIELKSPPITLQPTRLQITATQSAANTVRVKLTGQFRAFNEDSDIAFALVPVQADVLFPLLATNP